jgi:hypothetical protein
VRTPELHGEIERRLLVNYRVDPDVMAPLLPAPFRPQLHVGFAVAGICLIRLGHLRPRGAPAWIGRRSENAAHRMAVAWDTADGVATGVYIPRRDTSSLVNVVVGGRLFPGEHHRARFTTDEREDRVRVAFESLDASTRVDVSVEVGGELQSGLFHDLESASRFFERGSLGYSATSGSASLEGLELRTDAWSVESVRVLRARSSFFDDVQRFPAGSAVLDGALLMRKVPVTWHPLDRLSAGGSVASEAALRA